MSTLLLQTQAAEHRALPPKGKATDEVLASVQDSRILYTNWFWQRLMASFRKPELYDQNEQWLRPAMSYAGGLYPWQFVPDIEDPDDPASLPQYTFNEGFAPRVNETSRLARPKYEPICRPDSSSPSTQVRMACRRMTHAIVSEMYRMRAATEFDVGLYRMPLHGTWFLQSYLDRSYDDVVRTPVTGARACPRNQGVMGADRIEGEACDFVLASPVVGIEQARSIGAPVPEPEPGMSVPPKDTFVMDCPQCEDHPRLAPFKPSLEEAKSRTDKIGRPLGQDKPQTQWKLRTCSPYDVFLPNLGIGMRYDDIREWTEVHVESLDWVALHYPEHAHRVKKENPAKLMEYHPIAGSPSLYGRGQTAALFTNHVRVKETHQKPTMVWDEQQKRYSLNMGRSIVMANGVKLLDDDYLVKDLNNEGRYFERAWLEMFPWEFREGAYLPYGMSMWELMFSPQDLGNDVISQRAAIRERGAMPHYAVSRDANLGVLELKQGIPLQFLELDIQPGMTVEDSLRLINNVTMDRGGNEEIEHARGFIQDVSGRVEVEKGSVPPGVAAATAINLLSKESGTSREKRIDRIVAGLRRTYSHGARVISGTWIEPRAFSWDENGKRLWDRAAGFDFQGQTQVEIAAGPKFVDQDQKREAVRGLLESFGGNIEMVYSPQGRTLAKLLDAPEELYEQENLQEGLADREWDDFIHQGKRPVIDPSLDDPEIHWQMHGKRCFGEAFTELEERADWDGALQILGDNWDGDLQSVMMAPPVPYQVPTAMGPIPYASAMQLGLVPQANPMDMAQRVEMMWANKLAAVGWQSQDPEAFGKVVMWRSHCEAHKLLGQLKQVQAQMAPLMAAPGAEATPEGNQPTAGAPPAGAPAPVTPGGAPDQPPRVPLLPQPPPPAPVVH